MEISKRQAQAIVNNLKTVIQEDINFISPSGTIIASSDETRIGDYHEGAFIVAKNLQPLIIENDEQYHGAKKGINLPVFLEDQLVAIVGITGEINQIIQFSNVIVKMSEILVKENYLNTQKQFRRENNRVIMELVTKENFNPEIFLIKMQELGYDYKKYHYFLVAELENYDEQNIDLSNKIYNSIEKRLSFNDLLARYEDRFLLLSHAKDYQQLKIEFIKIKKYVENKYDIHLKVGISEEIRDLSDFSSAYQQASIVLNIKSYEYLEDINQFDGSSLEFLFKSVASRINHDYANRILKDIDEETKNEIKEIIDVYIEFNGSINKASDSLFIHKNTMQYRLNKIHTLTGYNPREIKDLIKLYIALQLDIK
jgi:carbohydrate diacid regulator